MPTNPTHNRLSLTLADDKVNTINQLLDQLTKELDFAVGLTADERQALPKMNDGNQPFVTDALSGGQQNAELLPPYVKLDELARDLALYAQLGPLVQRLLKLGEQLLDTRMLAGSEAYVSALMLYRLAESAAKSGLPGADTFYRQLRKRFQAQGEATAPVPPVA